MIFYSTINWKIEIIWFREHQSDCECKSLLMQNNSKEEPTKKTCAEKHHYKPGLRLFYNRVPKSGSTTLITLLRKLSKANGFKHFNSKIYDKRLLNCEEQNNLIKELMNYSTPCSFDRHVFYIDFAKHAVPNPPQYINVIREPVERIISSYFYRRIVAVRQTAHNKTNGIKASDYWIKKKFESCVLSGDPECSYIDGNSYVMLLVPYFCGQNKRCLRLNDEWALQQAKRNIESSYKVIGILEHIEMTLSVLENKLPKFFAGVSQLYFNNKKQIRKNENNSKENVTNEVKQLLKRNLTNEYELYNFALQRLYKQHFQIIKDIDN